MPCAMPGLLFDKYSVGANSERLTAVRSLQTEAAVRHPYQGAPDHITTLRALAKLGRVPSGMFPVSQSMRQVGPER